MIRVFRGCFVLILLFGRQRIRTILGNIKDDAIPAVLADKGPIDGEQNLLPRAQFMTAVRAGIRDPAGFGKRFRVVFIVVNQGPTPVLK